MKITRLKTNEIVDYTTKIAKKAFETNEAFCEMIDHEGLKIVFVGAIDLEGIYCINFIGLDSNFGVLRSDTLKYFETEIKMIAKVIDEKTAIIKKEILKMK